MVLAIVGQPAHGIACNSDDKSNVKLTKIFYCCLYVAVPYQLSICKCAIMMALISTYDFPLFIHIWTNSQHMQTTEKLPPQGQVPQEEQQGQVPQEEQQGQVPQEEQQGQVLEDLAAKPVPRVQELLN